jgi:surface antigen
MLIMVMVGIPALSDRADAAAGYNPYPWGQCTWYAFSMRPDLSPHLWGNAYNWAYSARVSGASVGYTPRAGAIVVFQPGVQGAWGAGHVGYVLAVGGNGRFLVAESHFPYLGRITHRWAHAGRGVSFIY